MHTHWVDSIIDRQDLSMSKGKSANHKTPSLGILCVHGIGNSGKAPGHLPNEIWKSLSEAISNLGGSTRPLKYRGQRSKNVSSYSPTHQYKVSFPEKGEFILRLYDGAWHPDSPHRTNREVFLWLFKILPFLPIIITNLWISNRVEENENDDISNGTLIGALFIFALTCTLSPLAFTLLAIITILPSNIFKHKAQLTALINSTLGDAYSYQRGHMDPTNPSTIVSKLIAKLKHIKRGSDTVLLVGHSQGGELCRRVSQLEPVDGCVYVGSGEAPLTALRILQKSPFLPTVIYFVYITFPVVFAMFAAPLLTELGEMWNTLKSIVSTLSETLTTRDPISALVTMRYDIDITSMLTNSVIGILIVSGYAIVLFGLTRSVTRRPDDVKEADIEGNLYVRSSIDPVSFGSLTTGVKTRYIPYRNYGNLINSVMLAHVSYFKDWHTGGFILEAAFGSEEFDFSEYFRPKPFPLWIWALTIPTAIVVLVATFLVGSYELDSVGRIFS